ncbi:S-layer homology domain-containing protein [Paenibacillus sp. alder61]|uniref:S-layer homology domain-containing protein n=1 Tax=Paenibacillus sp. alder61 TaxID=2862948 RepID=UPI001CD62F52|nr:S-layer homology domain-containing protein [Paenibacillus sp. alder61]MCA1291782.1 S-layer homology domain-containing protein [Paenibacillus sp. alder61]
MSSYKRTFRRSTKKAVSAMLVTAMCLGGAGAVFAEETPAANTAQTAAASLLFSDVKDGFWAEKHIYKLAAEGIVLGDAGKFRPGDSVTQQEAITMAIRFMNLESKLGDGSGAPAEMKVSNYFKPYLQLAVEQKLIDKAEEVKATGAKESWGEKKASREWIAKLLVRSLGRDAEAKSATGTSTGFTDQSNISAEARGYVNVAVQLNLTKGVAGNKFDPKGKVTRAELATFFSRGSEYVTPGYANVYEGIVTELTDNKLTLYADGKLKSFTLDNRSVYFTKDSETKVSKKDLKPYTKVLAVDKVGAAAYIEVRDPKQQLEQTEGTLLRVLSGNKLLMLVNNDSVTFTYDNTTSFLDQNGNKINPEKLTNDSTVVVQRETFTAEKKPVIVQVKSAIVNKSGSGTIDSVSLKDKTIQIKDTSGNVETFKYDDGSVMLYQNQLLNNAGEIQTGASVKYTVENSVVTRLEITQGMERTVKGTLLSVEGTKLLSYTNASGVAEIKPLAEKPTIIISGIAEPTLNDLIADVDGGDKVELTINADDQITKIAVTGRESDQLTGATIINYDSKLKALTVMDTAEKPYVFVIDAKTKYDYNSKEPSLAGLESLLEKGRKINIKHIGSRAISVQVMYKYEGTFVTANTNTKKVTILQADGKSIDIPYQGVEPTIELYGKTKPTLGDIKSGEPVAAVLSGNQDALQTLAVKKSVQFEIQSVNTSNSRIRVVADGISDDLYVDQAKLLGENGAAIRVADLQQGQTVNVEFTGRTVTSLQVIKLTLGKITNIDGSTLTIKSFTGTQESYPLADGVKVIRGTAVSKGASGLATSDHVEVSKDTDGSLMVKVLTSLERKVSRYDANSKELIVLRAGLTDSNYRFFVTPETYIHQGDTTISVQSLKENDKIVLYFNGDKLVEVEKQ